MHVVIGRRSGYSDVAAPPCHTACGTIVVRDRQQPRSLRRTRRRLERAVRPVPVAAARLSKASIGTGIGATTTCARAERDDAASPSSLAGAPAASSWCGRSSRARVAGLLQLSWMGDPVSQYGDILAEKSADALELQRAAWAHLLAAIKPDLVWLPRVREDATIAPLIAELGAFRHAAARRSLRASRGRGECAPSRNRRRNAAKTLAKLGDVTFRRRGRQRRGQRHRVNRHRLETRPVAGARHSLTRRGRSALCSILRRRARRSEDGVGMSHRRARMRWHAGRSQHPRHL